MANNWISVYSLDYWYDGTPIIMIELDSIWR
jgi:hypothetical protein